MNLMKFYNPLSIFTEFSAKCSGDCHQSERKQEIDLILRYGQASSLNEFVQENIHSYKYHCFMQEKMLTVKKIILLLFFLRFHLNPHPIVANEFFWLITSGMEIRIRALPLASKYFELSFYGRLFDLWNSLANLNSHKAFVAATIPFSRSLSFDSQAVKKSQNTLQTNFAEMCANNSNFHIDKVNKSRDFYKNNMKHSCSFELRC